MPISSADIAFSQANANDDKIKLLTVRVDKLERRGADTPVEVRLTRLEGQVAKLADTPAVTRATLRNPDIIAQQFRMRIRGHGPRPPEPWPPVVVVVQPVD
jgi:hypothetical protein